VNEARSVEHFLLQIPLEGIFAHNPRRKIALEFGNSSVG
jgi:hypothetical protein